MISSLIRCSNTELIHFILEKYASILAIPVQSKKRMGAIEAVEQPGSNLSARSKHSGILAYTALVHSYPYTIPTWMPSVIMSLIENVAFSPLVTNSVEKCLQEFKRTHQDTWTEDKLLFTEYQLEMINDLQIIPSYFV